MDLANFANDPGLQAAHATFEFAENVPASQAVQVDAPSLFRVFVTDPGEHAAHSMVLFGLKDPAAHLSQEVAESSSRVLV